MSRLTLIVHVAAENMRVVVLSFFGIFNGEYTLFSKSA